MKRLALALAAGAAVSTLAYASASALTVDGGTIQAGKATISCDTDGVEVHWGLETDDNSVSYVKVTDIDAACTDATMFVKLNNGDTESATIAGGEVRFNIDPAMTAQSIKDLKIWIEG
jgi:hypothetical protein